MSRGNVAILAGVTSVQCVVYYRSPASLFLHAVHICYFIQSGTLVLHTVYNDLVYWSSNKVKSTGKIFNPPLERKSSATVLPPSDHGLEVLVAIDSWEAEGKKNTDS